MFLMFNCAVSIDNGTEDSPGVCFHVYLCDRGSASAEHVKVSGVPTFTEVVPSILIFLGESVRNQKSVNLEEYCHTQYNIIKYTKICNCNSFM